LLEDGFEHLEHEALAGSRQLAELLEVALELGSRPALAAAIGQAKQGFDGQGEVLGQGGQELDRKAAPLSQGLVSTVKRGRYSECPREVS